MSVIFETIEIANEASEWVAAKIQAEDSRPDYFMDRLCNTIEMEDGRGQMILYHPYLEDFKKETGNDFELQE